jgi:hypothetical protein
MDEEKKNPPEERKEPLSRREFFGKMGKYSIAASMVFAGSSLLSGCENLFSDTSNEQANENGPSSDDDQSTGGGDAAEGTSFDDAIAISAGSSVTISFNGQGDRRYYRFQANGSDEYWITVTKSYEGVYGVTLYDQNRSEINAQSGLSDSFFEGELQQLNAATYYLVFTAESSGSFDLTLDFNTATTYSDSAYSDGGYSDSSYSDSSYYSDSSGYSDSAYSDSSGGYSDSSDPEYSEYTRWADYNDLYTDYSNFWTNSY